MKEIIETWENMKFTVQRYFKGTQERGFILGSVDEIIQILDDNAVNLQSISGSRFVAPFLGTVHNWEKTLSLIGEVIEVGRLLLQLDRCPSWRTGYISLASLLLANAAFHLSRSG